MEEIASIGYYFLTGINHPQLVNRISVRVSPSGAVEEAHGSKNELFTFQAIRRLFLVD
jgi:hypothetical protein